MEKWSMPGIPWLAMNRFRFSISTISSVESYEARFGSERLERFRQCWEIEKGKCNEVTKGP